MAKLLFTFICIYCSISSFAQQYKDLVFAKTPERDLALDIYLPAGVQNPDLVVWVHGGAWHSGSKADPPMDLLKRGYALASIEYRLSVEAPFPAMVHDIKAAIRFLRGNAEKYGFKKDKIIIWGSSAGGHLVALAGLTNGNKELEGDLGEYLNESSDVNLVVDFFGPTDFTTILRQSTPHGVSVRAPALALLLGKPLDQATQLAKVASPVYHVDQNDPPVFIAHGNQDPQVPINQSIELWLRLKEHGVKTAFEILPDDGHGGPGFSGNAFIDKVVAFIETNL